MKKAYVMNFGNKDYILNTDSAKLTKPIIQQFIQYFIDKRNIEEPLKSRILNDELTINDFRYRIEKCEYELRKGIIDYYYITGKNFIWSIPLYDECIVFIN